MKSVLYPEVEALRYLIGEQRAKIESLEAELAKLHVHYALKCGELIGIKKQFNLIEHEDCMPYSNYTEFPDSSI